MSERRLTRRERKRYQRMIRRMLDAKPPGRPMSILEWVTVKRARICIAPLRVERARKAPRKQALRYKKLIQPWIEELNCRLVELMAEEFDRRVLCGESPLSARLTNPPSFFSYIGFAQ